MYIMQIHEVPKFYKNEGQHKEQCVRFTLTGKITRADNLPCTVGGDCESLQIKSERATICKGYDIASHLAKDKATLYGYVTNDFQMYVMTKVEFLEFAQTFATATRESNKNGGQGKLRLKSESKQMLEWLKRHA